MLREDMTCPASSGRLARFKTFAGTLRGMLLLALIFAGLAYLVFLQPAFLLAILPFSVLLACPLMHVFMHRGHGSHGGQGNQSGHQH